MKNRSNRRSDGPRQVPLDHLRPGGGHSDDRDTAPGRAGRTAEASAAPAESTTPGGGEADAVRGNATRSPAETATRPHLEGSEQGPR